MATATPSFPCRLSLILRNLPAGLNFACRTQDVGAATWRHGRSRITGSLVGVRGQLADGTQFDPAWVFPDEPLPVLAKWFTGTLKLPLGNLLEYVHMGFASFYEDELRLTVERGVLVKRTRRNASPFRWLKSRIELWRRRLFSAF